jgi:hypothetical protein
MVAAHQYQEAPMRIHATWLILAMALAGCAKANAATVDPNDDFDCAVTFDFFREMAKLRGNAPDKARQGLFVFNQWYAAKWQHDHPGAAEPKEHALAMVNAMGKDPSAYKDVVKSCANRAAADPKFNRFADLVTQQLPDAR